MAMIVDFAFMIVLAIFVGIIWGVSFIVASEVLKRLIK